MAGNNLMTERHKFALYVAFPEHNSTLTSQYETGNTFLFMFYS